MGAERTQACSNNPPADQRCSWLGQPGRTARGRRWRLSWCRRRLWGQARHPGILQQNQRRWYVIKGPELHKHLCRMRQAKQAGHTAARAATPHLCTCNRHRGRWRCPQHQLQRWRQAPPAAPGCAPAACGPGGPGTQPRCSAGRLNAGVHAGKSQLPGSACSFAAHPSDATRISELH